MNTWKQNIVGLLGMFALGLAFGPSIAVSEDPPKVEKSVTANEFILVDGEGKKRAELSFGPAGAAGKVEIDQEKFEKEGREYMLEQLLKGPWPRLAFFDHEGNERLVVGVSAFADSPIIKMTHPDGSEGAILSISRDASLLKLAAIGGSPTMVLSALEQTGANIELARGPRDAALVMAVRGKGHTDVSFMDANKKRRIAIGLDGDGSPSGTFFDADRHEIWKAP